MALMAIAPHQGRPHTPRDQAWIETFFGHIKGEWPHLQTITDPTLLEAELVRVRTEYNSVRLHEAIPPTTNTRTPAETPSGKPAATVSTALGELMITKANQAKV